MEHGGRDSLEAQVRRHGEIQDLGSIIESGAKPAYEDYIALMSGETDPPIDRESTGKILAQKIKEGQINPGGVDIIICSPKLRAIQTSELVAEVSGKNIPVHPAKYLREVNFPMEDISPEFYQQASGIKEVQQRIIDSLLAGKKIDEDVVDVYKRAQHFLTYFRRVRKWTGLKPLFVTHGMFSRFLNLAINHGEEELTNEQIRFLVQQEFSTTKRPGVLDGFKIMSSKEGIKIAGMI